MKLGIKISIALVMFFVLCQVVIFGVQRELWFDPSFSLEAAHRINVGDVPDWRVTDVHSPLFYYLLSDWQKINPSSQEYVWGQELSVLFGLFFIVFMYLFLSHWFNKAGQNATLVLACLTPYLHFGTEVRGYMLLMAMCALVLWLRSIRRYSWLVYSVVFIAPFIHYFAVLLTVIVVMFDYFVHEEFNYKALFAGLVGAIIVFFLFALPQQQQAEGTWYFASTITSFPSTLFYTVFLVDDVAVATSKLIGYFLITFTLTYIAMLYLFFKYSTEKFKSNSVLMVMLSSVMFPLGLLGLQTFIPDMWRLYHHRVFLPVTWLFVAAILVILFQYMAFWKRPVRIVTLTLIALFVVGSWGLYAVSAHHELGNMMEATPCLNESVHIFHESPFSALPYIVYARDHGCLWNNSIVTDLSVAQSHTAGFDIMDPSKIHWNMSLPVIDGQFYYVIRNVSVDVRLNNTEWVEVASDLGIILVLVRMQGGP